jgi:hypothetical protein
MEINREVPPHLRNELAKTERLCMEFFQAVLFLALGSARSPKFSQNHLLAFIADDYLETALAIPLMARESIHNACRRELRFLLEMSIKLCFVQQASHSSSTEKKVALFQRELNSPNIALKNRVQLFLIPEIRRPYFLEHVGRIYGEASNYVHLTAKQLRQRLTLIESDRLSGAESLEEIKELNQKITNCLAASFVFVAHAVSPAEVGDLFVTKDGSSHSWDLSSSQYIAYLDEYFDNKHERQSNITAIRATRWKHVEI